MIFFSVSFEDKAVIWDHALHFLVRDPHEELQATVIYQGKSRTADQVPLFPKKVRESLRVSRGDRGGKAWFLGEEAC